MSVGSWIITCQLHSWKDFYISRKVRYLNAMLMHNSDFIIHGTISTYINSHLAYSDGTESSLSCLDRKRVRRWAPILPQPPPLLIATRKHTNSPAWSCRHLYLSHFISKETDRTIQNVSYYPGSGKIPGGAENVVRHISVRKKD